MDVLITGGHGVVGTAITDHLGDSDEYEFTLLDVEPGDDESPHDSVVADVRDYDAIRPHFEGRDAVVHLALVPGTGGPGSRELGWSEPLADNLEALHNVYEAAVDADLDSIVFASSNHAVGMVEVRNAPEIYHDRGVRTDHTEPHRPDSRYGLTKSYGEDLGRLAAEAHGIRFYALRIGSVRAPEYDHPYGDAERGVEDGRWERGSDAYEEQVARLKGLWQSRRDLAQLVDCCLRDDSVEWDHFYGVSGNERRWLDDLDHARETVGYEPRDDGEEWDAPPE
ncbi:NAD(P)-dependent oxidoreductase [Haloprofundus sp. MHR1]|uniref:NAD-dependent epimerase/dehydratase family protein n=1 Tax=Haloprofundus sp. MHR1 TaxID=2572921 RepID=UPI0010BEB352|nr:NAD(P)-dependent oxidoreductase [Haloprofundus sp. MHR1]QCJ46871.1 NAD(P)-dependent oxidoreductase [Haloprofundus sp. MHR1]